MSKYKIVYIQPSSSISGAAISLFNILREIDRSKFEPYVIICSEGPLRKWYESLGIPVFCALYKTYTSTPTPHLFDANYYYNFRALFDKDNLKSILDTIKPDVVHVNDKSALIPGKHAFALGYKVVWHLRSTYTGKRSYLQYVISKKIIENHSSHLIAISEDETDGFEDYKNLSVIYNSVDLSEAAAVRENGSTFRKEFNIAEDEIAVGMIGNIDKQKGAWNFINAARLAKQKLPNIKFRFFIVAPIPQKLNYGWRGKLKLINTTSLYQIAVELVKKNGIAEITEFTNRRNDMLNVMLGLDIVSAVYNLEAIGRPALETAAVGKTCIVNKGHSGHSNMVLNNTTGIIVEKETPQLLADAIVLLVQNEELRNKLGQAALEHASQNFDSRENCRKIENIYTNIINS